MCGTSADLSYGKGGWTIGMVISFRVGQVEVLRLAVAPVLGPEEARVKRRVPESGRRSTCRRSSHLGGLRKLLRGLDGRDRNGGRLARRGAAGRRGPARRRRPGRLLGVCGLALPCGSPAGRGGALFRRRQRQCVI